LVSPRFKQELPGRILTQEDQQDMAQTMQTQLIRPDGSRPRILFAEDSDTVRLVTAALLRRMGCDVDAVEHGEEAVFHACRHPYDLVLLDIEMPVMDGMIAARAIRALGGGAARTPLMALSAYLADWHKGGQWHECFDMALPKPAGRSELHLAIQKILR
jgi:CheY-like chemotaxis protein